MKHIFELSSRPDLKIDPISKHNLLINFFETLPEPWKLNSNQVPIPEFGDHFVAIVNLDKFLGKGIKCSVFYRYRNMLEDNASDDDRVYIEFNSKKVDFHYLVDVIFPKMVEVFNAYKGIIYNEQLMFVDFEKSRNKNLRETIYRFYPVNFLDEQLCQRALRLTSKQVADKLDKQVEKVEIYNAGVLIIGTSKALDVQESNEFDLKIRNLLGVK